MPNPSLSGWFKKKRDQAKETLRGFFNDTEDKVVDRYLATNAPYKHMPKGHRDRVRKVRRVMNNYKSEIDGVKRTGKTAVRMWVWYSLIRMPANLDPDSGFMLKASAQGLRILAVVDMAMVLNEWSKQKEKQQKK